MRILEALHARDALGRDLAPAERLQCQLVDRAADAVPCACVLVENRDGGMPERWWDT